MPIFQIEMFWDCIQCQNGKRNRGLSKHCRNCGKAKGSDVEEYMPDHVTVADALNGEEARKAEAGPDWKCKYCDSLQNSLNKCCDECGCPQEQGAKDWVYNEKSVQFNPNTGAKEHESEVTRKVIHPNHTEEESAASIAAPSYTNDSQLRSQTKSNGGGLKTVAIIGTGLVSIFILLFFLLRTSYHNVHVSGVAWKHDVIIEKYQVFHKEGWTSPPGSFDEHYLGPRVHHYDHVIVGNHQETYSDRVQDGQDCRTIPGSIIRGSCHTTPIKCTPNKNGAATCKGGDRICDPDTVTRDRQSCTPRYKNVQRTRTVNDYEDQPRFQSWFGWSIRDWAYDRTVSHSGNDVSVSWPADDELKPSHLDEGDQERISARRETHDVIFSDGKDTWNIQPDMCKEFQKYRVGTPWRIKTGVTHGVEVLP